MKASYFERGPCMEWDDFYDGVKRLWVDRFGIPVDAETKKKIARRARTHWRNAMTDWEAVETMRQDMQRGTWSPV